MTNSNPTAVINQTNVATIQPVTVTRPLQNGQLLYARVRTAGGNVYQAFVRIQKLHSGIDGKRGYVQKSATVLFETDATHIENATMTHPQHLRGTVMRLPLYGNSKHTVNNGLFRLTSESIALVLGVIKDTLQRDSLQESATQLEATAAKLRAQANEMTTRIAKKLTP